MEEKDMNKIKIAKKIADAIDSRIRDVEDSISDGLIEINDGELLISATYDADVDVRSWHEEWEDPWCWVSFQEIRGYDVTISKVEVYDYDTDTTIEDEELLTMINDEFGQ